MTYKPCWIDVGACRILPVGSYISLTVTLSTCILHHFWSKSFGHQQGICSCPWHDLNAHDATMLCCKDSGSRLDASTQPLSNDLIYTGSAWHGRSPCAFLWPQTSSTELGCSARFCRQSLGCGDDSAQGKQRGELRKEIHVRPGLCGGRPFSLENLTHRCKFWSMMHG